MTKRISQGQTILEFMLVTLWTVSFFGAMYYIATVFDVGHKQTMLNRNQAFIELGNFSYFGSTAHGEDKVDTQASQVTFKLGEKSRFVKVDLDKVDKFKKAVEGELVVDVRSTFNGFAAIVGGRDDPYWNSFNFPKAQTTVNFLPQGQGFDEGSVRLTSQLSIALNRSIDFEKTMDPSEYNQTGMFSGSLHFNQFAQVANLEAQAAAGLEDNVDQIKRLLRQIVKNNPSLSEEAKALEENVNIAESISGGAVSSLISLAISAIAQAGFAAVSDATGPLFDEGVATGAEAAPSALDSYFDNLTSQFTDPYTVGSNMMGDNLLAGPLNALAQPFVNAYEGFAGTMGNLGSLAAGSGSLVDLSSSLAQIGQTAQLGAALAGQNIEGLNIATAALALPSAVVSGMDKIDTGMNYDPSHQLQGGVNMGTVFEGVGEISSSVSNFLVTVAPELALPMSYVNTAVSVLSIGTTLPEKISDLGAGTMTTIETVKAAGELTANLGQMYSGVAHLTGQDGSIGSIMQMVGGATMMAGSAAEFMANAKLNGFDVALKDKVDANLNNARDTLNGFQDRIAAATDKFNSGMADLMASGKTPGEGDGLFAAINEKLIDPSTGAFSDDRVADKVTMGNLIKMDGVVGELETKLLTQYKLNGADPSTLASMSGEFAKVRDAVDVLQKLKAGSLVQDDTNKAQIQAILKAGNDATNKLNASMMETFKDSFNQKVLRGMMNQQNSNQWSLAQDLVMGNQKFSDAAKIEGETYSGMKSIISHIKGGGATKDAYNKQLMAAYNLAYVTKVKDRYETEKQKIEDEKARAMKAVQLAESISENSPIKADNVGHLQEGAMAASSLLSRVMERGGLDEKTFLRMQASQRKLDAVVSGAIPLQDPSDTLRELRNELTAREEKFRRLKQTLEVCATGQCPVDTN